MNPALSGVRSGFLRLALLLLTNAMATVSGIAAAVLMIFFLLSLLLDRAGTRQASVVLE